MQNRSRGAIQFHSARGNRICDLAINWNFMARGWYISIYLCGTMMIMLSNGRRRTLCCSGRRGRTGDVKICSALSDFFPVDADGGHGFLFDGAYIAFGIACVLLRLLRDVNGCRLKRWRKWAVNRVWGWGCWNWRWYAVLIWWWRWIVLWLTSSAAYAKVYHGEDNGKTKG